jgi:hypothetical protein
MSIQNYERAQSAFVTPAGFSSWIDGAKPGERIVYHVGYLWLDRSRDKDEQDADPIRDAIDAVANKALEAAERGLIDLVQEKRGMFRYFYIAVARKNPTPFRLSKRESLRS